MIYLHDYLSMSHANGPGSRAVVWTQGCDLACKGCFNSSTHKQELERGVLETDLADCIMREPAIEGVTISGGEPFQQIEALALLLLEIKTKSDLSTIVFTGYSMAEIFGRHKDLAGQIMSNIDVLIAGRYLQEKRVARGLMGSSNKKFHFLSERYSATDFKDVPEAEIVIHPDGTMVLTGIFPIALKE